MKPLPAHFMVSSVDGHLYDTRQPAWHRKPPLRANYGTMREGTGMVKAAIRQGYAWPVGYALYGITRDGAALCTACMRKEWRNVVWDFLNDASTGWRVDAIVTTADCDEIPICDHCSKPVDGGVL